MSLSTQHRELREHLQALEAEMRTLDLWSATPPSAQAMASTMPFMYDTLKFHQWLQWVFVPRLWALIDARSTLPDNSQTHALGEHEFGQMVSLDYSRLLARLQQIDQLLNTGPAGH